MLHCLFLSSATCSSMEIIVVVARAHVSHLHIICQLQPSWMLWSQIPCQSFFVTRLIPSTFYISFHQSLSSSLIVSFQTNQCGVNYCSLYPLESEYHRIQHGQHAILCLATFFFLHVIHIFVINDFESKSMYSTQSM